MVDVLNKVHITSYTFSQRIIEDCVVLWEQGYIPSIEQLKYEYEILDIDGRCLDPVSYYRFWSAIDHLTGYGFITIEQDPYMIKRISKGSRTIPEKLSYEQFWSTKD
ncbi:MAG: hypothetical protein ACXAAH_02910 [Promethearchaeota archaeon]|jgi:hypothetical protein